MQNVFRFSRSATELLIFIAKRVDEVLDKNVALNFFRFCESSSQVEQLWYFSINFRADPIFSIKSNLIEWKLSWTTQLLDHFTKMQLLIYADDTTIYCWRESKSDFSDKVRLVANLKNYLKSVVNWVK